MLIAENVRQQVFDGGKSSTAENVRQRRRQKMFDSKSWMAASLRRQKMFDSASIRQRRQVFDSGHGAWAWCVGMVRWHGAWATGAWARQNKMNKPRVK
jgi:hypothetical protein